MLCFLRFQISIGILTKYTLLIRCRFLLCDLIETLLQLPGEQVGPPGLHGGAQLLGARDPLQPRHVLKLNPALGVHELKHALVQLAPGYINLLH